MTIVLKQQDGSFAPFVGFEVLPGDVRMSPETADTLSDDALAALGLYRAKPFVADAGKQTHGSPRYKQQEDGTVNEVYDQVAIPPPEEISDRQFFQQLAVMGLITKDEALAAVGPGTIPATLASLIDTLPSEDQKFAARMLMTGATIFHRHAAVTITLGRAMGWSDAQMDALWTAASAL